MWRVTTTCVVLLLGAMAANAQRRPDFGRAPDPGPNRIEVRFALGGQAAVCRQFRLVARYEGRIVFSGKFKGGFEIPGAAKDLPRKNAVDLEFQCGRRRWHFGRVAERAFLRGYWWVGTDYPPFQSEFQGPDYKDAAWVRYLLVDPTDDDGFDVFKYCPNSLKDVKPGPCDED